MSLTSPAPLTPAELLAGFAILVFICALGATYFSRR